MIYVSLWDAMQRDNVNLIQLSNFRFRSVLLILMIIEQGPTVFAVWVLDNFFFTCLSSPFSSVSERRHDID